MFTLSLTLCCNTSISPSLPGLFALFLKVSWLCAHCQQYLQFPLSFLSSTPSAPLAVPSLLDREAISHVPAVLGIYLCSLANMSGQMKDQRDYLTVEFTLKLFPQHENEHGLLSWIQLFHDICRSL